MKKCNLFTCFRIYNLLKHWISRHWVDFDDNTEMIKLLQNFITLMATTGQGKSAESLEKLLKKMVCIVKSL